MGLLDGTPIRTYRASVSRSLGDGGAVPFSSRPLG